MPPAPIASANRSYATPKAAPPLPTTTFAIPDSLGHYWNTKLLSLIDRLRIYGDPSLGGLPLVACSVASLACVWQTSNGFPVVLQPPK
jgi:hypothetical protein